MNIRWLLHRNIRYFARYYRLVAMAVVITVAVIVGSLVVGDSVRMTLVRRVTERLGNTETIIFSRSSFISDSILSVSLLGESARGVLLTDGFISRNGKLVPVFVWGVDDLSLSEGSAKINPALSEELGLEASEDIVLRLPATGLVPSGSLFVTKNYTVGLRLSYEGLVPVDSGGNINLKNEQVLPFNVFVRRSDLAEALNVGGKINLVLTDRQISSTDLDDIWNQELSGLVVRRKADFTEITSGRVFLQEKVVETICQDNLASDRLFSYLVNSIEREGNSIPYSFITAMDRYKGHILRKDEILLSDYAANRLGARVGDTIRVSYYKSEGLKRLDTDARQFKVGRVVPLSEWVSDGSLSADFPGLSNEAEVGSIGGEEDGVIGMGECADPKECKSIADLGVDFLAAGIGNIHGKYPANWKGLSFETLAAVQELTGELPLVLHGGTGIPADQIKKAIDLGVSKINVNTECQLAFADATRKYIEAGKDLEGKGFDPRKLLAPGAEAIKATVKEKMELFGSVGKAE